MKLIVPSVRRPVSPFARRDFLRGGLAGLAALMAKPLVVGCSSDESSPKGGHTPDGGAPVSLRSNLANLGELGAADPNGVRMPGGFSSRIVAQTSKPPVAGGVFNWHIFPDGGATFATEDGGWVYVSNSEIPATGGVGALRFDAQANLVDAYSILSDSNVNCAGGKMPWGTWLSCEEVPNGRVFECDPFGKNQAITRPALGLFKHEAACLDPANQHVYLSEDEGDGRFYRFVPDAKTAAGYADLAQGKLEVAELKSDMSVIWHPVPDPSGMMPTRTQVAESTPFKGGEGLAHFDGVIYLSTKGDNRVWAYDVETQKMSVLYDVVTAANPILSGVDNLTVTCCGDVLVAEDGGDMQIVAILADGSLKALIQVEGHPDSEITGPAFDPSGTRLYFSSQRAPGLGTTFEVTGPFHVPA
jgi:uncharacterized protein